MDSHNLMTKPNPNPKTKPIANLTIPKPLLHCSDYPYLDTCNHIVSASCHKLAGWHWLGASICISGRGRLLNLGFGYTNGRPNAQTLETLKCDFPEETSVSPHFTLHICKYDLHFIHILALTSAHLRGVCKGGHGVLSPPMAARWFTINNIIVSGKAILSGEDSRKPLGGRGSTKPHWGSLQRSPRITGHYSAAYHQMCQPTSSSTVSTSRRADALPPTGSIHLAGQGRPGYNRWKRITGEQSTHCGHRRRIACCGGRYGPRWSGAAVSEWVWKIIVYRPTKGMSKQDIENTLQFTLTNEWL